MIQLKEFTVLLNDRPCVGPISFELKQGELLAITGPNGSGKSTLLRGMLGLLETRGELWYRKKRLNRFPAQAVGYVPQRFNFRGTLPLTVREFFSLSSLSHPTSELCSELKIDQLFDRSLSVLSGGELQRVVLARALARNPELLVLDEASAGIDALGRTEIVDLLLHLLAEHNVSIITVTHDTAELRHYTRSLGKKFHDLTLDHTHH
ncbi:ATP-binding cassette domain-containing protein [Candidatus Berkelbacteria bacterium]|nr:ATP-binding cassette domain-containing protein [Candidatus Berkelbacteria bacterium]